MKIIAEMAVNWFGMEEAKYSISKAKEIGCHAVKFQIFRNYDIKNNPFYEEIKHCILTKEKVRILFEYGKKEGIDVFFTCFFPEAIDWCEEIGVKYYKVREKDNHKKDLYLKLHKIKKPIFVSCQNIRDPIYYNLSLRQDNIIFLFCIPVYPADIRDYYRFFTKSFNGISDHTSGTRLIKEYWDKIEWLEKHIKLRDGGIEDRWAITFDQLEEVMQKCMR